MCVWEGGRGGGEGGGVLIKHHANFFRLSPIMCMSCNCSKLTYGDILILGMNQP